MLSEGALEVLDESEELDELDEDELVELDELEDDPPDDELFDEDLESFL